MSPAEVTPGSHDRTRDTGPQPGGSAMPVVNIVVPCYNEEEVLPESARQLCATIDAMVAEGLVDAASGIYFVDDGSRDRTWALIEALNAQRPNRFHGIKLTRNRGHQNALLAGLRHVPGDALVSIDADLQEDISAIPAMVRKYVEGHEVVYGVRAARDTDTVFKRQSAWLYYALLRHLGVEIVPDHADFRLLGRRALDALGRFSETNVFLRAIVPQLGFRSAQVFYERHARLAGESKYNLTRMIGLAINGVTSFSMTPLRFITVIGFVVAMAAFLVGLWAIGLAIFTSRAVPGWASVVAPLTFLGGLQLFSMGVIGEYIGKIYLEVKRRPLFEIERML